MSPWLPIVTLLAACSFAIKGPDDSLAKHHAPTCDTGKGKVLTDVILGSVAATAALSVADSGSAALVPALLAALFAGSAVHGNTLVEECRRQNEQYAKAEPPRPPAVAEDERDDEAPPPKLPVAPPVAPDAAPPVAPDAAPPPAPVATHEAPPPREPPAVIEIWVDFWKEVR